MAEGSADDVEATLPAHEDTGGGGVTQAEPLRRGRVVGRYVILEKLGAGGMGVVYRAYDPELDRVVALKLLHRSDDHRGSHGEVRLLREAQAMARLSHPNVIVVHDVGTHDDQVFIAMEYVDGQTLGDWIAATKPSVRQILATFLRAGEGLAAAHRAQLVHRDFKPDNVLVGNDGRLRVLDFGLVQFAGADPDSVEPDSLDGVSSTMSVSLTQTGAVMGTPSYMSPEQVAGKTATERSDQFSFCVALYEALYGVRPFVGDNIADLYYAIGNAKVGEAPSGSTVPSWLRRVVVRGLQKAPEDRYASVDALLTALRRDPARWRWRIAAATAVAGASAAIGLAAAQVGEDTEPCSGGRTQVGAVWADANREALRRAFEVDPVAGAGAAAEAIAGLDAYAESWAGMHEQVCLTAARGEASASLLDLQMSCLQGRRQALRGAASVLADADGQTVRNSDRVVAGLPPLARCTDTIALQSELAPPEDAAQRAEFDRIRGRIADNKALHDAGKIKRSAGVADEILEDARALGYAPLLARALHDAGSAAEDVGDLDRAATLLHESYDLALQTRQDRVAGAAAMTLAVVTGIRQGNWEIATIWERAALALARRNDPEGIAEANILAGMAEHARITGDLEAAEAHARRAYEIAIERTGERSLKVAERAQQLAFILGARGRGEEGLAMAQLTVEIQRETLGPEHPDVGGALAVVGILQGELGQHQAKLETLQRSVAISTAVFGRTSRAVGSALYNMGNAARELGRADDARAYFEETGEIYREVFGEDHPKMAGVELALGLLDDDAQDFERARVHYRRSIAAFERAYGEEHPAIAGAVHNLAGTFSQQEQHQRAYEGFSRALRIAEKTLGAEHPQTTLSRTDLGATLVSLGRAEEAVPILRLALTHRLAQAGDPRDLAHTRLALAMALWATDARAEALAVAKRAAGVYVEHPDLVDPRADEIREWIRSHEA